MRATRFLFEHVGSDALLARFGVIAPVGELVLKFVVFDGGELARSIGEMLVDPGGGESWLCGFILVQHKFRNRRVAFGPAYFRSSLTSGPFCQAAAQFLRFDECSDLALGADANLAGVNLKLAVFGLAGIGPKRLGFVAYVLDFVERPRLGFLHDLGESCLECFVRHRRELLPRRGLILGNADIGKRGASTGSIEVPVLFGLRRIATTLGLFHIREQLPGAAFGTHSERPLAWRGFIL